MEIKIISGCAIGKGIFASFACLEKTDVLPMRLVTECSMKLSKYCNIDVCPRFRSGYAGSHRISWLNANARI